MVAVLVADYYTPLGIAVWMVYLVPVVLTLFAWRPSLPFIVAGIATALMTMTLFTDAPGVAISIGRLNRLFGAITIWTIAYAAHQSIWNKLEVRRQEWLQTGVVRIKEAMAGSPRLDQLGGSVTKALAEYLGAHVGALFADQDDAFKRVASYALPAGASVPEFVRPGEGLIGQAVIDRHTVVVREVPEAYLQVGSGLGRADVRNLLIAPLEEGGEVQGVVELGFLRTITPTDEELMARISKPIAVAIRGAKFQARLQELSEETQRQNEELQAQSEELRVSNEELEEQGRALRESQARLENQQAELEQTNTQLEEQTLRLEQQRDELSRSKAVLETQARELDQASQYKSDFLANMSHELRTPLNSSLILAKLLADNRDGNLTEEQVKYAQTIHAAGNDLLNLINEVLDLSKIEAGHMEAHPESVHLSRLFESLGRTFQPVADQKGLTLQTHLTDGVPESIVTDPRRLEQVLKNLLSNALKFTDQGSVTLEAASEGEDRVSFTVRDTGIGIPEDQQAVVFEAFRQADSTTSRKYGGTGLGLSITRRLVTLLGGKMDLQSSAGTGSSFTVTLPKTYDGPAPIDPDPSPAVTVQEPSRSYAPFSVPAVPLAKAWVEDDRERLRSSERTILVVEDDAPFASILCDLAHELGFQCIVASSADEGIALAIQFVPNAVVLDLGLPDHSGLTVLDRLKRDARTRHVPVHVVSGSDYSESAMAMGAAGYMLKPVKRENLVEAFAKLESRMSQSLRRVLIVEDDPVQLESMRLLLGTGQVETTGAKTVAECLELLRNTTFDCMVLDLSLPDASGFSLLETLSQEDRYAFPPVIVYTGRELTADEEQRLRKYSKSIIVKGAKSPERLLDEVTLFLHQVVTDLPSEQQKMLDAARNRDAALEGREILIVEDDVRNVFAVTGILEPKGAKVRVARNGREALEALESTLSSDAPPIDLVLMDVMMPEMDGLTAMREIRKRTEWKKLPIIALTAKAMKNDQEACIAAGANDYMAKPLDVEKLVSLVRVWLPR
ncbi:response regulator [bacterium]|nr:MAG: response regulator [bacterium]